MDKTSIQKPRNFHFHLLANFPFQDLKGEGSVEVVNWMNEINLAEKT